MIFLGLEDAYTVDGHPTLTKDGYATVKSSFDSAGNQLGAAWFGVTGKPIKHRAGYSSLTARYDERGNQIEIAYFDTEGNRASTAKGYARLVSRYGPDGSQYLVGCFDEKDGPLVVHPVVTEVVRSSQAARVGLKVGDIIVRYNNEPISIPEDISRAINSAGKSHRGNTVPLVIRRGEKDLTLMVMLGPLGIRSEMQVVGKR